MSPFQEAAAGYAAEFAIGTRHGRCVTRSSLLDYDRSAPVWWLGPGRHPWHRAARLFDARVVAYLEIDQLDVRLEDDRLVKEWLDFATTRIFAATLADRELVDRLLLLS